MIEGENKKRADLLLSELGIRALKSFGQNFLLEENIAQRIVNEVPSQHLDKILEIGPGLGILTERLLERGSKITAIEKDGTLANFLCEKFSSTDKGDITIIKEDALKIIDDFLQRDLFIVSNLPFNISSRLTGKILDSVPFLPREENPFKGAVIMYQEEFARRLVSGHGGKEYGRLSVMFRSKMIHQDVMDVSNGSFYPVPKVNAKVVHFHPKDEFEISPVDDELFRKLVHVVFLNRRKKMKNSVNPRSFGLELEMEDIKWILDDIDLTDRRPEELPPEIFIRLSNRLSDLT
jgi:16S rRNA (adenine1518-N6/adenine1519-N6)-dimethyltransferase